MTLAELQIAVGEWGDRNFGHGPSWEPLMGAGEELGELFHAHLKGHQGIRHTPEEILEMKCDALADIIIYLLHYGYREQISLESALERTWEKVSKRDWVQNPITAAEEAEE